MGSAFFGYPDPWPAALMERLVFLLLVGPWLILLEAAAREPNRRVAITRGLLMLMLLDRLLADFRLWAPIAAVTATTWALLTAHLRVHPETPTTGRQDPGPRPVREHTSARGGMDSRPAGWAAAAWAILGAVMVLTTIHMNRLPLLRPGLMLFLAAGLYGSRRMCASSESDPASNGGEPDHWAAGASCPSSTIRRPSPCAMASRITEKVSHGGPRVLFFLLAAWQLGRGIEGLQLATFPALLAWGLIGWLGVQFLCWRARRTGPASRSMHGVRPVNLKTDRLEAGPTRPGAGLERLSGRILKATGWSSAGCAGVLTALLAGELYVRHVYDASDANGGLRTAQRWAERHVRLNQWGLRDRDIPPSDQLADLTRIVLLGDSFVYGWGINDEHDLPGPCLERALAGRGVTPPPRVFSLGQGGFDTRAETRLLSDKGPLIAPRVVVLAYVLNDIEPLLKPKLPRVAIPVFWRPLMEAGDLAEFVIWHACLRAHARGRTVGDLIGMAAYEDATAFAQHRADLLALMALIRRLGARPVAVIYPCLGVPTDAEQRSAIDKVARLLADDGVPVLDVSRMVDPTDRRYVANPFDPHPSAALHAVVAPALADLVAAELAKPPPGP
ncbi:MAG: SGNH/GDSL hydrolase family protein [Phycisphaerae bacterium]|jgi:hypothetical protein